MQRLEQRVPGAFAVPDIWQNRAPAADYSAAGGMGAQLTVATDGGLSLLRGPNLLESVNWAWGLSLIALTIAIHATGVVIMSFMGFGIKVRLETSEFGLWRVIPLVIGIIGAVGLLLATLHGIEAAIWAAAYVWLGALDSPRDAILYSVDSMTTRGSSGLTLQQHWRMISALESANGMLLFGISTAYIFAVMQIYWPMLSGLFTNRHRQR